MHPCVVWLLPGHQALMQLSELKLCQYNYCVRSHVLIWMQVWYHERECAQPPGGTS